MTITCVTPVVTMTTSDTSVNESTAGHVMLGPCRRMYDRVAGRVDPVSDLVLEDFHERMRP